MLRWEVAINEMGVPRRWDAVIVYALAIRAAALNRRLFHFTPAMAVDEGFIQSL